MKQSKSILTKINIAAFAAMALVLAAGCDKKMGRATRKKLRRPS